MKTAIMPGNSDETFFGYHTKELNLCLCRRVAFLTGGELFTGAESEVNNRYDYVINIDLNEQSFKESYSPYIIIYPDSTEGKNLASKISAGNIAIYEKATSINGYSPVIVIINPVAIRNADNLRHLHLENIAKSISSGFTDYLKEKGESNTYKAVNNGYCSYLNPLEPGISYERNQALEIKRDRFVNGAFFSSSGYAFHSLISNQKYLEKRKIWHISKKCGTFIINTDGSAQIGTFVYNSTPLGIHFLMEGFNLDFEANGSKSFVESVIREGHASNEQMALDLIRRTWRTGLGWNGKKVVVTTAYATADELRRLIRSEGCIDKNNNTVGIGLDGGSKACFKHGTFLVGRDSYQNNIIWW